MERGEIKQKVRFLPPGDWGIMKNGTLAFSDEVDQEASGTCLGGFWP